MNRKTDPQKIRMKCASQGYVQASKQTLWWESLGKGYYVTLKKNEKAVISYEIHVTSYFNK